MTTNKLLLIMIFMFFACTKDEVSSPEPEDCAGNSGGNAVCGCTDSTAYNYDSDATHDDGSCQTFLDNGDISALTYATVFIIAIPQIIGTSSFFLTAYSEEIDVAQKSSKFSKSSSYILLISIPSIFIETIAAPGTEVINVLLKALPIVTP